MKTRILVVAAILVAGAAGVWVWSGQSRSARSATPAQVAFEKYWAGLNRILPQQMHGGDAKVSIVEFLDWQCPSCRAAYYAYAPVLAEYEKRSPGAVRLILRDFPLNSRCNLAVPSEMHPCACEAAVAVRLARERGTADALIEWLFANQGSLTPDLVKGAAASVGRITDFDARYAGVVADIRTGTAEADKLEVRSTPTHFINGVRARSAENQLLTAQEFGWAIGFELKR